MGWIVVNNLAWIIGLLVYFHIQPEETGFSALETTLKTLKSLLPDVIRETRTGIYTNLYPRSDNGTSVDKTDTPDDRPSRLSSNEETNDDLIPPWETEEAYFGFPNLETDKWTIPTLPTE